MPPASWGGLFHVVRAPQSWSLENPRQAELHRSQVQFGPDCCTKRNVGLQTRSHLQPRYSEIHAPKAAPGRGQQKGASNIHPRFVPLFYPRSVCTQLCTSCLPPAGLQRPYCTLQLNLLKPLRSLGGSTSLRFKPHSPCAHTPGFAVGEHNVLSLLGKTILGLCSQHPYPAQEPRSLPWWGTAQRGHRG